MDIARITMPIIPSASIWGHKIPGSLVKIEDFLIVFKESEGGKNYYWS